MKTTKKILTDALKLIEKGWTTGQLYQKKNGKDCFCLEGALAVADGAKPKCETQDFAGAEEECFIVLRGGDKEDGVIDPNTLSKNGQRAFKALTIQIAKHDGYDESHNSSIYEFNDDFKTKKPIVNMLKRTIKGL